MILYFLDESLSKWPDWWHHVPKPGRSIVTSLTIICKVVHTVWEGPVRPKNVSAIGTPKIQNFRSFPTTYVKIKNFWQRFLETLRFKDFPL